MTSLGDDRRPSQPRGEVTRRWLAFALTAVALSAPIAGMFVLVWPSLLARTSIAADGIEVISLGTVTGLIGVGLAARIHRDRGTSL